MLKICTEITKEYNVARAFHWDLSGKCGFDRNDKWYNNVPESVLENEKYESFGTSVYEQTITSRLGDQV